MIARKFLYFILFIILLTFMVAYGWFKVQSSYEPEVTDIEQIYAVQEVFMETHKSISTIDLDFFYPTITHLDLLKPKDTLKALDWPTTASVAASSKQCREATQLRGIIDRQFKKEEIWEQYRCGVVKFLPEDFFRIPPFIHPTGKSYAYLAYSLNSSFKNRNWLLDHMMLFHVSELSELQDVVGRLPSLFHFLSLMNDDNLKYIEKKIEPILVGSFVLFPRQDNPSLLSHEYDVYLFDELEEFLSPTILNVTITRRAKICFYTQGQLCWNITPTQLWKHVSLRTIIAVVFLAIIIIILIWFVFQNLKRRVIEDEQRKLALQILGHELRTPIASMLLQLETLTQKMDHFTENEQDAIWGLSINIQRLRRLVEMTQNYLLLKSKNNNVLVKANILTSVNEYFEELCQEFPGTEFIPLEEDKSFSTDAHWLTICVKNILSNAHNHGQKPVKLFLRFHSESYNWLEIIIQDQGSCEYDSLHEMCQEFVKGKKSHGTGLGLNIVIKVLKAIGGELTFQPQPTTFTLRIKEGHYE
jgi:signal transduction histidine kinase